MLPCKFKLNKHERLENKNCNEYQLNKLNHLRFANFFPVLPALIKTMALRKSRKSKLAKMGVHIRGKALNTGGSVSTLISGDTDILFLNFAVSEQ